MLTKRKHKVEVLDLIHLAMMYYQRIYWGQMGTNELYTRMSRLYNILLNVVWE